MRGEWKVDKRMTNNAVKVFVSYAHESAEHKAHVLELATFLRGVGIEAVLDTWASDVRRDWSAWAVGEMTAADFVLVVASAEYRRAGDGNGPAAANLGVQSEAALLRELVHGNRSAWVPKILPVVLPGHEVDQIPLFLQPHTATHFLVPAVTMAGMDELLRVILGQPGHLPPEVSSHRPFLPPLSGGAPAEPPAERDVVNRITGTVNGKVIQAHTIHGDIHL